MLNQWSRHHLLKLHCQLTLPPFALLSLFPKSPYNWKVFKPARWAECILFQYSTNTWYGGSSMLAIFPILIIEPFWGLNFSRFQSRIVLGETPIRSARVAQLAWSFNWTYSINNFNSPGLNDNRSIYSSLTNKLKIQIIFITIYSKKQLHIDISYFDTGRIFD